MPLYIEIVKDVPLTNVVADLEALLSQICNSASLTIVPDDYPSLNITGYPDPSVLDAATLSGKPPEYYAAADHNHSINNLEDISLTELELNDILKWNGTNWINHQLKLDDLSNVDIQNISLNDILIYNFQTGKWVNSTLAGAGISTTDHNHDSIYLKLTGGDITGNLKISGTTKSNGYLYAGSTAPSNTTRLNYDGYFYATKLVSTATTGTAPLAVSSTTAVINLNADMVDGKHASDFIPASLYTAKGDLLVASNASTPTKLSVGNDGDVLIADSDSSTGVKWGYPTVKEIIKSSTTTLTTAEITGTIINNYGQSADVTLTLPAAAKGLTFMVIFGTQVSKYFRIQPNTNDQIYLNGVGIGSGKYVGVSTVIAGNAISFSSFQTGSSAYNWLAVPISGNWVAQA